LIFLEGDLPVNLSGINNSLQEKLYFKMMLIRRVEEKLLELFSKGELFGTTHTSIGQEAIAVASLSHIAENDIVFSNHRCHGHYLAYGGPVDGLIAEVMGRISGVCGGRGGSQHICYKNFYTNGIQGGIVANATGAAFAEKLKNSEAMAVVFLGDGTLGEGIVYESLNMASLWSVPILYILENNRYAQTTPLSKNLSGSMLERPRSFGIDADQIETNDVMELFNLFEKRFDFVRTQRKPFFQIVDTYRLAPHSKGDDFRDPKEILQWLEKDPLKLIQKEISQEYSKNVIIQIDNIIDRAINEAKEQDFPHYDRFNENLEVYSTSGIINIERNDESIYVHENINRSLSALLNYSKDIVIMGEDILDPYGGAFKITKGLSTKFPNQVITTPISEAGIVGFAIGMALQGVKPIVEIMFGDFLALCADQLLNHASKYNWMYNTQKNVPLVIRTPMGGRRGYGPTHSQSIEKMFMGIPGLYVVAPSIFHDPGKLLCHATLNLNQPVLFIENKEMYADEIAQRNNNKLRYFTIKESQSLFPTLHFSLSVDDTPQVCIFTYGRNIPLALEVAKTLLIEDEILVDVIAPSLLSPLPTKEIMQFMSNSPIIVTLEEGTKSMGWGAEVIAEIRANSKDVNKSIRIATPDLPIPSSKPMELQMVPSRDSVIKEIRSLFL
jgi:2-oxoisovalerate dehydrogenase E1 component